MIEVHLIGTGGTVPLPKRWLTSLYLKLNGKATLIDCGEGTQIALQEQGLSLKQIDQILLTHYHADHTAGLPGLLLTMAKSNRQEAIHLYGPKGIEEILKGVKAIARYIPFEIIPHEIQKDSSFYLDSLWVHPISLSHSVECYGYAFQLSRQAKFMVDKAKALEIPVTYWSILQKGKSIEWQGRTIEAKEVLGPQRKGISLVYATDTRPNQNLLAAAKQADLLITEGMYGDLEKLENAVIHQHMMMQEACALAKEAQVKSLWLTHYSPSMPAPFLYEEELKSIFDEVTISKDGQQGILKFQEEEGCTM